ncbi:hypothetical protein EYF80_017062 [Liparis tanakae]|uniref:Uncharacterized protein n=1 Tax=Liparis tanakae TaxID=230148 RepID=A0A4Z2I491_9TELE|nr:hypothetical protein EYF80_017062 [Liparis tanakae]
MALGNSRPLCPDSVPQSPEVPCNSAPLPVIIPTCGVRGRLHQSVQLESSKQGNCPVWMCESNKKISGYQNLWKTSNGRAKTQTDI